MKRVLLKRLSRLAVVTVAAVVALSPVIAEHARLSASGGLSRGLTSPEQWVLCNRERGVCYDRFGASIGLTDAFLGPQAAAQLTAAQRGNLPDGSATAAFSPAAGVECGVKTGPCRVNGEDHGELTHILYGPPPLRPNGGAPPALLGTKWEWRITRFNDDRTSEPPMPGNYTLQLQPGGTLSVRADCNSAGGQYQVSAAEIHIEISHSTMAACPPGSLDTVFLRDLSRAMHFVIKAGRLYLDLEMHTGTMEFGP